jgi:hypothetical protein
VTLEVLNGTAPAGIPSETGTPVAAQDNAATASAQTGGEVGGDEGQVTPKTYTEQEHRDAIERATARAAAKAERRAFREATQRLAQQQPAPQQQASQPTPDGRPQRAQFATQEAYEDAVADWRLDQREAVKQTQTLAKKTADIYAKAEKLEGFDRDAFDELPLTRSIVEAMIDADAPEQLMAYMAANAEEVERIASLPAARQAAAIGKLEAKLEAEKTKPPARSNAPSALGAVKGKAAAGGPPDPSDTKAYIKWANEQEHAARR